MEKANANWTVSQYISDIHNVEEGKGEAEADGAGL